MHRRLAVKLQSFCKAPACCVGLVNQDNVLLQSAASWVRGVQLNTLRSVLMENTLHTYTMYIAPKNLDALFFDSLQELPYGLGYNVCYTALVLYHRDLALVLDYTDSSVHSHITIISHTAHSNDRMPKVEESAPLAADTQPDVLQTSVNS